MNLGESRSGDEQAGRRRVLYCLVPADLAPALHDLLRAHYRDEPRVEVVVEQRHRHRRSGVERRVQKNARAARERRRIRNASGRRIADRRTLAEEVEAPGPLPRRARRHAGRLLFVDRLVPSTQELEDEDTARLVVRFQAGEQDAFAALYTRYFDRIYGYMRMALASVHEAEDATQQVFLQLFEKLPGYERRRQPFRAWLFVAARNHAVSHLRKHNRIELTEREELERHRDSRQAHVDELPALEWISDRDVLMFLERLPAPQRQVLVMRYMLDLDNRQIAQAIGRSPESVKVMHHRALGFLRKRLAAVGRDSRHGGRARLSRRFKQAEVLRHRRFALR